MSAFPASAIDAIAYQLVAALDRYELDTARMVDAWPDMDLYHEVSAQLEEIRMYCVPVTGVRVQWVDLLIAHAELVHVLWRVQYGRQTEDASDLQPVREHHADCIQSLRQRCLRYLARSQAKS